ncbi:uncharacterized protein LOC143274838 [Babylonia areolata]|uniref:uncharacterized protein LOC143274838 n=1 Tax=Babylonia areolata TaxID=304850 RepID=UPI003FD60A58
MLIFGLHDGERITLDVNVGMTVRDVREMIQILLNISVDQYKHDKKVLVLSWAGSDLQDPWVFSDLGIVPGSTIRVNLKEEVKPVLHIHCSHSQDTISLYDNLVIGHMHLDELRSLVSRKTGLPVGIFRLVTKGGKEMYDGHRLEDYGIDVGHTILLENLDGWNEFLNLAIMGFTPQVVSQISPDENTGRYQMKVALFVAAHYGHVDLARAMLRQGVKASEPVGYPPQRMWCTEDGHMDSRKAAVHQAVEMGQLGVLRLFVNNDITVITAKDGQGLAPLNIALRKKIKNCASFLLTKQWSKVNITKHFALHIGTYTHLRQWCERAKERTFMKYGHAKSSLKRRPFQTGPLVGFGVSVDGFSPSIMTGKSKAQLQREKEKDRKKLVHRQSMPQHHLKTAAEGPGSGTANDPESYFKHVSAVQNLKSMGDKVKVGRWGRAGRASSKPNITVEPLTSRSQAATEPKSQRTEEARGSGVGGQGEVGGPEESLRLPPIMQRLRSRLLAQSQVSVTSEPGDVTATTQRHQVGGPADVREGEGAQHLPQPPPPAPAPGERKEKEERSMMVSRLVKSRGNAYFMTGGTQQPPQPQPPLQPPQAQPHPLPTSQQAGSRAAGPQPFLPQSYKAAVPSIQLPVTDRSEVDSQADTVITCQVQGSVTGVETLDTASTITTTAGGGGEEERGGGARGDHHHHNHLPRKDTLVSTTTTTARAAAAAAQTSRPPGGVSEESGDSDARKNNEKKKRGGKKGRVSSALLLSKAKSSEGSVPLPLISHEQDRRPFFYYNGKREDAFIDPTISTWSRHSCSAGTTPRERAIKSLSVANTFKDKPWLGQVRIALQIAANPTKRNVRRLRSASKRAFAIK